MDVMPSKEELAYYLLNNGPHIASYNPEKAKEFVQIHGEDLFLLYYLFYQKHLSLNMINKLYDANMLNEVLTGYKSTIDKLKLSFYEMSNLVRYTNFTKKIIAEKDDNECQSKC